MPAIDAALYVPPESPLVAIALGSGGVVILVQDGWMRKGVLLKGNRIKRTWGGMCDGGPSPIARSIMSRLRASSDGRSKEKDGERQGSTQRANI